VARNDGARQPAREHNHVAVIRHPHDTDAVPQQHARGDRYPNDSGTQPTRTDHRASGGNPVMGDTQTTYERVTAQIVAALEGAVVVYLRALYYPAGFTVALRMIDTQILAVEITRELATIVMIAAIGYLTGSFKRSSLNVPLPCISRLPTKEFQ